MHLRWITRRAERTSRLQRFRTYWVWRHGLANFQFEVFARLIGARQSLRQKRSSLVVAGSIGLTVGWSLLAAILVVVVLEALDRLIFQQASILSSVLPDRLAVVLAIRFRTGADPTVEQALFSTVAQISGIFLGLYFAAVSAIAAAVYADVPGEVRLVLIREKVGNVYIRTVAFMGAFVLILLSALSVHVHVGLLNILFAGMLSALSVLAFVALGYRAFNFFSPDTLVGYLISDVIPLIDSVQRGSFGVGNRAIPYNYQRRAEDLLDTLHSVIRLSSSRKSVTARSLLQIVRSIIHLLYFYASRKANISSDSLWFKQRVEHPDWLTASHSTVDMALRTQTAIHGTAVPDRMWFEHNLQEALTAALDALMARGDVARTVEGFNAILVLAHELGSQLAIDEALELINVAQGMIDAYLAQIPSGARDVGALALADIEASLSMQIVLGMSDRLRPLDSTTFARDAGQVDPLKPLKRPWPRQVLDQREYLARKIASERLVEHRRITADWYLTQLVAVGMTRFYAAVIPQLLGEIAKLPSQAERALDRGQALVYAQLVQRGIECCRKFADHFSEFQLSLERLSSLRRAQDIPWAETDWAAAQHQVSEIRNELLVLLAKVAVLTADIETGGDIPDYFGGAYAFLAEECFSAMVHEGPPFDKLFPAFFHASLTAHERLRRKLQAHDQRTQFVFSTETIEDLLEISGYALLLGELGRPQYWNSAKPLWDAYLTGHDRDQFFRSLFAVVSLRDSIFALKPRDISRTSWQMAFQRYLAELGLVVERHWSPLDLGEDENDEARSPLVRAAIRGMIGNDAGGAFVAGYLLTWPEAQGLELPRGTQRFLEALQLERRRDSRADHAASQDDETGNPAQQGSGRVAQNDSADSLPEDGDQDASG